jgi:DNA-binding MarR family transcriptional regulator
MATRTEDRMYDYMFSHEAFTTSVLLEQAWQTMYNTLESKLAKTDLTPQQAYVLWFCKYYPPPLTPAEIARMLFRKSQSIAGLLARMEREGLVKRVPKRKGHPFTEVQITAEGEKRLRDGRKVILAYAEKFMSSLSAEEDEQLRKLLRKVRENGLKELREELTPVPGFAPGEVIRV